MDDSRIIRGRLKFMSTTETFCFGNGRGMECVVPLPRINGEVSEMDEEEDVERKCCGCVRNLVDAAADDDSDMDSASSIMDKGSSTAV